MKLVTVSINDKIYRMQFNQAKEMINMLKKEHKGKNVILAIGKESHIEMRKDTYSCAYDLLTATQEWLKKGYKVYSVKTYL